MKKVFVNGYGSIGSRITQFIADDKDIEVIGVGKYSPDDKVADAISRGFDVYVAKKKALYEPKNVSAIFQGGEKIGGEESVANLIFNSRVNYEKAFDAKYVMQ